MKKRILLTTFLCLSLLSFTSASHVYELIDLGILPRGNFSLANSINNNGQIVGQANTSTGGENHAAFFNQTLGNIDLGTLGGELSAAYAINNAGQITGEAMNLSGHTHAAMYELNANVTDLDTLGGSPPSSIATAINNDGDIVGYANINTGQYHAVYFDPYGDNIDLNALIDSTSGWTLTYANSINDNDWIVGLGINPSGENHASLLQPSSEPSTQPKTESQEAIYFTAFNRFF